MKTPPRAQDAARIRYAGCEASDVPEMCRLVAETFTRSDPPAIAVGVTPDEFEAFAQVISKPEATRATG